MSDDVFYEYDGVEYCDEELALAALLRDGVLFANERDTVFGGQPAGSTVVLYVNCSDTFGYACADAETLPYAEIGNLYRMHRDGGGAAGFGEVRWCCLRRGERPLPEVERQMRDAGAWDEALESLPPNPCRPRKPEGTP